jgi:hypothetical protein
MVTNGVTIPAYDLYGLVYSSCDKFNRALKDRKLPNRHGGKNTYGDPGHQMNFAISSILQNTFNAYRSMRFASSSTDEADDFDYQHFCNDLASQSFEYANSLE